MKNHLLVCGLNGSGKSTFGRALAERLNYTFKDIEYYYFPNHCAEDPYTDPRSREEVSVALSDDLLNSDSIVLAAVKADYSREIERSFSKAIYIKTPKTVRLTRIRERSFEKFGERMLGGGDLYEKEETFFRMAEKRPDSYVEEWLSQLDMSVIRIDGTRPVDENVDYVISFMEESL